MRHPLGAGATHMTEAKLCRKCGKVQQFYGSNHTACKECAKARGKELRAIRSTTWRVERVCQCGSKYLPHTKNQAWCHRDVRCPAWIEDESRRSKINGERYRNKDRDRQRRMRKDNRRMEKLNDPIHLRAREMSAKLHWGRGSAAQMDGLLRPKIGTPCRWCGVEITIKNVSLDHRQPILRSKIDQYTAEELTRLNASGNLDFICLKCNRTKSTIPEEKYAKLLSWLKEDAELEMLVLQRLRKSNLMWGNR